MAAAKTTKKTTAKKADEIKTIDQLQAELQTKITDQLEAKRSNASGELVNPRVITGLRKDIARLHTAIRAIELTAKKESK
ncbi:MAG: rpmC [Candidatus Saccharibacteria bacterium]|nr:rpmC [Candidatus Saccharibacteria bacterium]